MKRLLSLLSLFAVTIPNVSAQCEETQVRRVLMVGDSWSVFMNADGTFNNAFRRWGHSDKRYFTNLIISENGSKTGDFLGQTKQQEIAAQLEANPTIDVVHLSIGGNDVLGSWHVSWSAEEVDSLELAVTERLLSIMDFIKSVRPGIRIVWSGYAYPNFGEVIGGLAPATQTFHPFYDTWQGMGFPDFITINNILNTFSAKLEDYAEGDPDVDFVNCTGILQHVFGQPTPLGVEPGGTYMPFEAPLPFGFPDYPSPRGTMRSYFGAFTDAFHLSAGGYDAFIDYQFRKFYQKYFMDDIYLLAEEGGVTGGVSGSGAVSSDPMLGTFGGEDHVSILSFRTDELPDTTVTAASIFIRRKALQGSNVYTTPVQMRVKRGFFGANAAVEPDDFDDMGEAVGTPCVFGSNQDDGNWVRLDLPEELLPYITNQSDIQIAIAAPDVVNGLLTYSDASDRDFAPVLNLTFGPAPASVTQPVDGRTALRVYPNPSTGVVNIDTDGSRVVSVEVLDMQGARVSAGLSRDGVSVDMSLLPAGTYLLHVVTEGGSAWSRVIRC